MKHIYKLFLGLSVIVLLSCEDPNEGPVFYYEDLAGGTYVRLVENSDNFLVDLNSLADFTHTYTVEFVDSNKGSTVQSYTADLIYKSGTESTTVEDFISLTSDDFTVNDNGFTQASITITSADLLAAFSLLAADLSPEDEFELKGEIVTPDYTFNSVNSSATVEGAFFQGYFDFTVFVGCASNLAGKYLATSTAINCSAETSGATTLLDSISFVDTGNIAIGEYELSDATFGVLEDCFGDGDGEDNLAQAGFQFKEICGVVSFSSLADEFGTNWDFSSVISGNDWIITWTNPDTGMGAVTSINFPDGIDFSLE